LQSLTPGACAAVADGQTVASVGNAGTLVAHLHFEMRTYDPAEGPEGQASRVIDPYGWTGVAPDPWADPAANFQAQARDAPTWIACGNGRLECGEACDDGNAHGGDCCDANCQLEAAGSACDDGDVCTAVDVCDGAGACLGAVGPDAACRVAERGTLLLRDREPNTRDVLTWKWTKGAATFVGELGHPVGGATRYEVCVFDESAGVPSLVLRAAVEAGGTCKGSPCWKALGGGLKGFRYGDREAATAGLRTLVVKPGAEGKAKVIVKGKGGALPLPALPLAANPKVTVQLVASTGACWASVFDAPPKANDAGQFKATFKALD
jgi:cysteine-rich repeat protein